MDIFIFFFRNVDFKFTVFYSSGNFFMNGIYGEKKFNKEEIIKEIDEREKLNFRVINGF